MGAFSPIRPTSAFSIPVGRGESQFLLMFDLLYFLVVFSKMLLLCPVESIFSIQMFVYFYIELKPLMKNFC